MNLLNLVIAIPAIGFILALLVPRTQPQMTRMLTLGVSLLTFVLSLGLATGYQLRPDRTAVRDRRGLDPPSRDSLACRH